MTGRPVLLDGIAGQARVVDVLQAAVRGPVHAYLFVGPPGTGKREAALAFGTCLLCPQGGCGNCDVCRRALAGVHPGLVLFQRSGASITVDDAREISRLARLHPMEGTRQVLLLDEFHLVESAAPALLKTIEEPPPTTVFVIVADFVPPDLVTIASRCARVEFRLLSPSDLADVLMAQGHGRTEAEAAAELANGSLDRAAMLVADNRTVARLELWKQVPGRLDGTGATVARLADELMAACEEAGDPVRRRQESELAELGEVARSSGERGIPGRKEIEDRHKREQRRVRTDELRAGLTVVGRTYRDRLARNGSWHDAEAFGSVGAAAAVLGRNPNESLLLYGLLLNLWDPGDR